MGNKITGWDYIIIVVIIPIIVVMFGYMMGYMIILVGGIPTPLKNMISSAGMMKFPIYGKIKNVPNHQPGSTG